MIRKVLGNQGVRFILVGLFNTGVDFGIYAVLVWFNVSPYVANYISTAIAMTSSYYMNRTYTFKSTGAAKKREVAMFFIVTIFGLWVLQPLTIFGAKTALAATGVNDFILSLLAKVVATLVSLTWNYGMYSRVVFATKGEHTADD